MPASRVPNMAGEKSAAITGCLSCASGIAIDPAPHPISSTDSPGFNANSFIKSRAYGAVSSGRNAGPAYPPQKNHQPDAERPADASIRHSNPQQAAQIELHYQSRAIPLTTKKRLLPKEEPQPAYIRKRTVPTPNRRTSQVVQERSNCNRDRTQLRSRCAGAPGRANI